MTVVDIGAGDAPDPRATATADLFADADHQFDATERWPFEDASLSGVVMNHTLEHMADPLAIFEEAGRVLEDGGWFEVTLPVGIDSWADDDHELHWQYRNPELYCRRTSDEKGRPWDPDPPFTLVERDVNVWLFQPFSVLTPLLKLVSRVYPAEAIRRCSAGELTAKYRRVAR